MGRRRSPGLRNRGGIWHIEKQILGRKIHEGTRTSDLKTAELIVARRVEEIRQTKLFGVRPGRTFREAATKFLEENIHLASIGDYAMHLKQLDPFIGDLPLQNVHLGTLQPFIEARRKQGIKTKSINLSLGCVRRILNLAARLWRDENGLTWLETAPLIQMLPVTDARRPYPLSWEEQHKLFQALPDHLTRMCLFNVNTGCREQEVCQLRWDWEVRVPELNTSVFIVPGEVVKNGEDRLVVLNWIARSVIEEVRGKHSGYVLTYGGHPVNINNTSWKRARILAAMDAVRNDPECAWITDSVECEGTDIRAEVRCQRSDSENKSGDRGHGNRLIEKDQMARPERFELPTAWFVARYSIQLSYGRVRRKIIPEIPPNGGSGTSLSYYGCAAGTWRRGIPWAYRCHLWTIASRRSRSFPANRSKPLPGFSSVSVATLQKASQRRFLSVNSWRRERDSNPRWSF